jgi:hypothetical protein
MNAIYRRMLLRFRPEAWRVSWNSRRFGRAPVIQPILRHVCGARAARLTDTEATLKRIWFVAAAMLALGAH